MQRALFIGGALLVIFSSLAACKEEKRDRLYFAELKPPLGIGQVTVVSDVSLNKPEGGEITVLSTVEPTIDRDELDRLMDSFFRQVSPRRGFEGGGKPAKIELRFYVNEAQAQTGGDDWLARVQWTAADKEPLLVNRQKAPLLKWVQKALGKEPQYSGELKPRVLADPEKMAVELTIPFVTDDGSGIYVDKLTNTKAITEFVSYTRTLFDNIAELQKLTFIGRHNDAQVMNIWLSRDQYEELDLRQVEESLGAFQGQFIEPMMSKQISEKAVEAKMRAQRRKVYREALARLPQHQVEIAKELR